LKTKNKNALHQKKYEGQLFRQSESKSEILQNKDEMLIKFSK